jgi:hypothetical protein
MIGAIHSVSNSNKRLEERSIMRWRKRGNIAPQRLSAFKARAVVLGLVCHYSASYPKSLAAVSLPP